MTTKLMVGFTGRANNFTTQQHLTLMSTIRLITTLDRQAIFGCNCGKGADEWLERHCMFLGINMWHTDDRLKPMPRNRELARRSDILLAAPPTDHILKKGSGSWETVKYAWKYGKATFIALPNGSLLTRKSDFMSTTDISVE